MRTYYTMSGEMLQYPDALAFAYNPFVLTATPVQLDADPVSIVDLAITCEGVTRTLSAYAYNGKVQMDAQSVVRLFFDQAVQPVGSELAESRRAVTMRCTWTLTTEAGDTESDYFDCLVIWGATKAGGENFNTNRKAIYYPNYPLTVSVYTDTHAAIVVSQRGETDTVLSVTPQRIYDIPITAAGSVHLADTDTTIFDDTFDDTFAGVLIGDKLIEIEEGCDIEDGVYLRWYDRHGFLCHRLFERGTLQVKVSTTPTRRDDLLQWDDIYRYQGSAGTRQSATREDVIPVCATLVDKETWETLCDLATSPAVDMYVNGGWVAVNILAATYQRDHKDILQDWACQVVMPEINIQRR